VRKTIENSSAGVISSSVSHANAGTRVSAWRTPVAIAALSLVLGLSSMDAQALALGRVNVQSAIGEPLRAEIEVPDISAEEAASLKASIAGPDAFKAAGLEYNPALSGVQISLQRRSDGRAYLRLSSDRPVNEPFVDLILEANWSSGRIVRDYTMLFDPPNLRAQSGPSAITSPIVTSNPTPLPGSNAPVSSRNAPSSSVASVPTAKSPAPARAPVVRAPAEPKAAPAPKVASAAKPGSITVKAGNTATQLAARYKPQGVSLDQMLVAMLNANPDAFTNGNINRLKTGAVMDIPSEATASSITPAEARQTIVAQSKDFGDFRRRLAQGAPTADAPAAGRKATGSVQTDVQERKPVATAPDKLTLSKGAVAAANAASAAKASKEETIAKDKQAKDAAARSAELSKNIQDLNKLNSTTTVAKPTANAASAATGVGVAVATGSVLPTPSVMTKTASVTAPVSVASAPASAPVVASVPVMATPTATLSVTSTPTTVATASATTVTTATEAKIITPVAKAPPPPEPSFVDGLLGNPATLPVAGGLLAALAGFGFYRLRQRKNATQVDSSFLESRLQPDSFFGASGGQRVDTNDAVNSGNTASSSMVYSPSQLDAAGDVDPVAEADVYLAYGRDLQAEEILKEALRTNPSRIAVHSKLMEIYAKRRDARAFESVAKEAFAVTKGQGSEWETACALGRDIDPGNPLYQGGSASGDISHPSFAGAAIATVGVAAVAAGAMSHNAHAAAAPTDDVDFDLDLDFSSGDEVTLAPHAGDPSYSSTSPIHVQSTASITPQAPVDAPVDLAFDMGSMPSFDLPGKDGVQLSAPDMASFASGLNFSAAPSAAPATPTAPMAMAAAPAQVEANALEFDLGDLSLDLPKTPAATHTPTASAAIDAGLSGDPLETKLALAQEFREIGDNDGARSLAQEVAAEASGALKARAQRMVADLS
jgi:pilus assembly protein FimV